MREPALHHDKISAHIVDPPDMFDSHRAALFAPPAIGAVPHGLIGRDIADHVSLRPHFFLNLRGVNAAVVSFACQKRWSFRQKMFALLDDQVLRIESFARGCSGAVDHATAAFEACGHVEQLFPGELLDFSDAECIGILEILNREKAAARREISEEEVYGCDDKMAKLRKWKGE